MEIKNSCLITDLRIINSHASTFLVPVFKDAVSKTDHITSNGRTINQ
jgi:hypothetical protein